ncbi:PAS domain-containing protein [Deinococcus sp. UYEF24]
MTGYGPAEVLGRNPRFLQGKNTDPEDRRALREALAAGQQIHRRILNYSRSGEELWFDMHVAPVFVAGKLTYFVAVQNDSSVQVSDYRQLHWSANHDALTDLLNRSSLSQVMSGLVDDSALIL